MVGVRVAEVSNITEDFGTSRSLSSGGETLLPERRLHRFSVSAGDKTVWYRIAEVTTSSQFRELARVMGW